MVACLDVTSHQHRFKLPAFGGGPPGRASTWPHLRLDLNTGHVKPMFSRDRFVFLITKNKRSSCLASQLKPSLVLECTVDTAFQRWIKLFWGV